MTIIKQAKSILKNEILWKMQVQQKITKTDTTDTPYKRQNGYSLCS